FTRAHPSSRNSRVRIAADRRLSQDTPPARQWSSCIALVSGLEPTFHFGVNVFERFDGDAVRNAVLLGEAAGIDQAAFRLSIAQGKAEIDAGARCRLDLRKHVI